MKVLWFLMSSFFLRRFSLVTPFGNVEINLDFICSCQCEKDENTVSRFGLYLI